MSTTYGLGTYGLDAFGSDIQVQSAISGLRRHTLVVYRKMTMGVWVDGLWVEAEEASFTILASVQPLTQREMEALPEGRREKGGYTLYTSTKVDTVSSGVSPDEVSIDGVRFIVHKVEPWRNMIRSHYKMIVVGK